MTSTNATATPRPYTAAELALIARLHYRSAADFWRCPASRRDWIHGITRMAIRCAAERAREAAAAGYPYPG